ncbi:hypothetical protein [Arthrobacter sp. ES1]|uniref:hypothetical protein n=1 Tax=Arthrobacter sp. ES1 TaxID=1897056 RepID=UPI001CFFD02C|nr:hypothetical protein [Arthrobacter sp. ES1]MCB5280587.1 hypothetical protein [Arthrobacter sp. ES1]
MPHVYNGGRCIFCNSNDLDVSIYAKDEVCTMREEKPLVYSTSTGESPSQSHGESFARAFQLSASGKEPRPNRTGKRTP